MKTIQLNLVSGESGILALFANVYTGWKQAEADNTNGEAAIFQQVVQQLTPAAKEITEAQGFNWNQQLKELQKGIAQSVAMAKSLKM